MKVVVLAGGISTERDVSLISGKMIYQAMKRLGHQAVLLDVFLGMERDDIDHIFESDEDFSAGIEAIHEINPDISAVKALRKDGGKCYFGPNVIKDLSDGGRCLFRTARCRRRRWKGAGGI